MFLTRMSAGIELINERILRVIMIKYFLKQKSHLNGTTEWDHYQLEAAKSSLVHSLAARESEISNLAGTSVLVYYKKISYTFNRFVQIFFLLYSY